MKTKAKRGYKAVAIIVCVIAVLIALAALGIELLFAFSAILPIDIRIDEARTYQTMDGFGFSAAWTFQDIGASEAAADKAAELLVGETGLKMDVIRYNIGAGTLEVDGHSGDPWQKRTESFFVAERFHGDNEAFADPDNYDFASRDVNAMRALDACMAKGNVKTLVLFANSPHYLLTANGMGKSDKGAGCNLPKENYGAFIDYLLVIAGHFYQLYGERMQIYLSPINEPQWDWDTLAEQEGCHYEPEQMAEVCALFLDKLDAYNLAHGTRILPELFDSGTYNVAADGQFVGYIDELASHGVLDRIDHLAVHSYCAEHSATERTKFKRYANRTLAGREVYMSEYCVMRAGRDPSIDMGLDSLDVMLKDLTCMDATRWCWWLGASYMQYEDGLIYYDADRLAATDDCDFLTPKRYYCYSQVTRYVDRGDVRIYVDTPFTSNGGGVRLQLCAFKKQDGAVVLIAENTADKARRARLPEGYSVAEATVTDANSDAAPFAFDGTLPAKSAVTFVLTKA